jgi:hypothetical protein
MRNNGHSPRPDGTDDTKVTQNAILSTPSNYHTAARLRVFLDSYARTGHVRLSCLAAGIAFKTHYRKLKSDPVYRAAFVQVEQHRDRLMWELMKRFQRECRRERVLPEVSATVTLLERMEAAEQGVRLLRQSYHRKTHAFAETLDDRSDYDSQTRFGCSWMG